jgi:AcrR family transcriptional regulator
MKRTGADTPQRILDAAERLFARGGFAATSLRAITAEAGVNLAAVNYHFRSKEALIEAVFARRLEPVNRQRFQMLEAAQARTGRRSPPLEAILEALAAPALRLRGEMTDGGVSFQRLMGRIFLEPGEHAEAILQQQLGEVAARFRAAFEKALPQLPPADLYWRIHFLVGAMAHTLAGTHILPHFVGDRCDPADVEGTIRRLVAFLAAGLRAPVRAAGRKRSRKT